MSKSGGRFDVVIVGAGPAGLAAARRATEAGASVALVDDNPAAGGQIWRAPTSIPAEWKQPVTFAGARVFGASPDGRLSIESADGDLDLEWRSLILATGARERFLPFPGWTLPNVMGAGGLQALAKSGMPIEGKSIVVAGSGPLLLAVAKYLHDHGAKVKLIAEQADVASVVRFGIGLVRHPEKLAQAVWLQASLVGIPYVYGCWPISAQGNGKLEAVTLRRGPKTRSVPCDYLACGFGLIPNTEVAELLGCRLGATGVEVDERQQTSVANVYAAGEATGIGGLDLSLVEGEIAGYAAAGKPDRARPLFAARQSARQFAVALDRAFALRGELKSLPNDDTLVCRCEDVTWSRIRACSGWRAAKLHTRCGMGPCQGRVCGGAVEFLTGWTPLSVRPPIFPVRIGSLTGESQDPASVSLPRALK